ncbi:MAG: hypothetical protein DRJ38_00020 [Thermoprotei archaeon]|nr:MAG: hypothetical protein DRJ38_00020 [Thermoprotei archaeon]
MKTRTQDATEEVNEVKNTVSKQISLSGFEWQRIGNVLKIKGTLLETGVWTGLDGIPTYFPLDVIHEKSHTMVGKRIKRRHQDTDESVIGFVTAVRNTPKGAEFEGIIFDQQAIDEIELGIANGLSIEADVICDEAQGQAIVKDLTFTAVAVVENPACPTCRIEAARPIKMEVKKTSELADKPTRTEFFDWLKEQLKNAGIPDEYISKVIDVLKKAIKTPYPYPYPSPEAYPGPEKKEAELEKPTRAQFLRWLRNQLKKAGISADDVKKVMDILKKAIKTPYPYPYPSPKKMEEGEMSELEKELEEKESELEAAKSELEQAKARISELESKIKEYEAKLNDYEEKIKAIKLAEIKALVEEIKKIDESFDAEKFLEGVEDLDMRKKLLKNYLENIKKFADMTVKLSVDEGESVEAKVQKVLSEMGISDVKALIEG